MHWGMTHMALCTHKYLWSYMWCTWMTTKLFYTSLTINLPEYLTIVFLQISWQLFWIGFENCFCAQIWLWIMICYDNCFDCDWQLFYASLTINLPPSLSDNQICVSYNFVHFGIPYFKAHVYAYISLILWLCMCMRQTCACMHMYDNVHVQYIWLCVHVCCIIIMCECASS